MAKVDIQEAYRAVLVYPSYEHLLGLSLERTTFIHKVLHFGLHSAPKLIPCFDSNDVVDAAKQKSG